MPNRVRTFAAKLRAMLQGKRIAVDLEDEVALHIQMLTDRLLQQGIEPEDAAAAARRQFGNSTLLREQHYMQSTFSFLTSLWRDVRSVRGSCSAIGC